MAVKTKAELMKELEEANVTITSLRTQLEEAEMLERLHDDCEKAGTQIKVAIDALVEGGLTEAQAWELIITTVKTQGGCFR